MPHLTLRACSYVCARCVVHPGAHVCATQGAGTKRSRAHAGVDVKGGKGKGRARPKLDAAARLELKNELKELSKDNVFGIFTQGYNFRPEVDDKTSSDEDEESDEDEDVSMSDGDWSGDD